MFRTLLLAAGLFCTASAMGSNIRRVQEEIPAADLVPLDEVEPNFGTPIGWVISKVAGDACKAVCFAVEESTCNAAALASVDTEAKLKYVVETALGGATGGTYVSGTNAANPLKSGSQGFWVYNAAGGSTASTCEAVSPTDFRICCCNADATKCPTSGGWFDKRE